MKVGLYTLRFPKTTETWAARKFVGLRAAGVDVEVYSRYSGGDWDRFPAVAAPEMRAHVHCHPERSGRGLDAPAVAALARLALTKAAAHPGGVVRYVVHNWRWRRRNGLGFWRGFWQRLTFVGADLDVLHLELDTLAPGIADLKHYLGCKLVLSARSTLEFSGRPDEWPGGYSSLFDHADLYHVECRHTLDDRHRAGLPAAVPVRLLASTIDAQHVFVPDARAVRERDAPLRLLSVGRLEPEKGLEFAIAAAARVVQAGIDVRYTIVGDGKHRAALEFCADQFGLLSTGQVRFAGSRPPDQVIDFYRDADVLVHASIDEGVPNVPIEAQAMVLPVVATAAAGTPDTLDDGVTGYLVPVRDVDALAARLIELAADPQAAAEMGQRGRERALRQSDFAAWIAAYRELYEDVARSS